MATYLHGSTGSASVNGTTICITGWDVDETADMVDVSSTCSNGYHEVIPGLISLSATINGNWDSDATPLANPPNLKRGTKLTNVRLNVTATSYYNIPVAYVESFKVTVDVNDAIKWTATIKSSGSYTTP